MAGTVPQVRLAHLVQRVPLAPKGTEETLGKSDLVERPAVRDLTGLWGQWGRVGLRVCRGFRACLPARPARQ